MEGCDGMPDLRRIGAVAGLFAPILWLILILVLGLLEPGFNQMTDMMSILGGVEGLRGYAFNFGVMFIGLLVVMFSIGMHQSLNEGDGSKLGPIMLAIGGAGMVASGIFHCDEGCANFLAMTPTGMLHLVSAAITGFFTAMSLFAFYFRVRRDSGLQNYALFTLIMAILGNGSGILLWVSYPTDTLVEFQGLIQRLGIVFPLLWIGVMALVMLMLSSNNTHSNLNSDF
jgi:hypothetical membrane protein